MFTNIDVTFLLIFKFANHGTKEAVVSTANRPFATNDHMVQNRHAGGQAHSYSPTGTLKQRQVKPDWFKSLCFNVPVGE